MPFMKLKAQQIDLRELQAQRSPAPPTAYAFALQHGGEHGHGEML